VGGALLELRRLAGVQFDPEPVDRLINGVMARDENRAARPLLIARQTALDIGLQIEKLAGALDSEDHQGVADLAGRLRATAGAHGITPIAEVAAWLEQEARAGGSGLALMTLTMDLMELCRSAYNPGAAAPVQDTAKTETVWELQ
jgi:hypothetical protein